MSSTHLTLEELREAHLRRPAGAPRVDWRAVRRLLKEIESILSIGETLAISPEGDLRVTRRKGGLVFSRRP